MSLAIKAGRAKVGGPGAVMMGRRGLQGDPGLFGDIGGFLGGVAGTIGGFIPGPIGGILTAAGGLISGSETVVGRPVSVAAAQPVVANGTIISRSGFQAQNGGIIDINFPFDKEPGFGIDFDFFGQAKRQAGSTATARPANGKCQGGFHPNKATYFLKSGQRIMKGTVCVKNRRTNPMNDRAASNAIKRLESGRKAIKNIQRVSIRCAKCPGKCVCR